MEDIKKLEEYIGAYKTGLKRKVTFDFLYLIENLIEQNKELEIEKEYYKKVYNESFNFVDTKFTGNHIPRID